MAWNEPGGKKNPPPGGGGGDDVEAFLNRLKDNLGRMFGGGDSGRGGSGKGSGSGGFGLIIVGLILVWLLFDSVKLIDEREGLVEGGRNHGNGKLHRDLECEHDGPSERGKPDPSPFIDSTTRAASSRGPVSTLGLATKGPRVVTSLIGCLSARGSLPLPSPPCLHGPGRPPYAPVGSRTLANHGKPLRSSTLWTKRRAVSRG